MGKWLERRNRKWLIVALLLCSAVAATIWHRAGERTFRISGNEDAVLHWAEQLLIRDCMSREGFRYWPEPYDPAAELKRFPYFVDDVAWAKAHGFGRDIEERLDGAAADNPNQAYFQRLPGERRARALTALHGDKSGPWLEAKPPAGGTLRHSDSGCTVEAWRRLYIDVASWYRASRLVSDVDGTQVAQVLQDPRYLARVELWRACMKARGYTADSPGKLRSESLSYQGPGAMEKDRRAAVNEAECAQTSGLSQTTCELDESYAAALRSRYKSDYETVERLKTTALPLAREVVSTG